MKNKSVLKAKIFAVIIFIILAVIIMLPLSASSAHAAGENAASAINDLIEKTAKKQDVPGISVATTVNGEISFYSYGYAEKGKNTKVNENTFYELGSVSKAYTALGILLLEKEEKLSLSDPITKYIPWLELKFGKAAFDASKIKIENLVYHTSGFTTGSHSIKLPAVDGDDALKKSVQALNGSVLDFLPSTRFGYASCNYIMQGYIIEVVSGMSFEAYITEKILLPLGLNGTKMFKNDAVNAGVMATGHKAKWFASRPYVSPVFRGHTPTGYIISSASDMAKWLNLHMDIESAPENFRDILAKSLIPDKSVAPAWGNYYAAGWHISEDGKTIGHAGGNPDYVTDTVIIPDKGITVAVLMNSSSGYPENLLENIVEILEGNAAGAILPSPDVRLFDTIASVGIIVLILALITLTFFIVRKILIIVKNKEKPSKPGVKGWILSGAMLLLTIIFIVVTAIVPFLFNYDTWSMTEIWAPATISPFFALLCVCSFLLTAFAVLSALFPKKSEILID